MTTFSTRPLAAVAMTLATLAVLSHASAQQPPQAQPLDTRRSAEQTYRDIQATLGIVPGFFRAFPESGVAGAWAEMKGLQLNPHTALSAKHKELIGLAVAAQIPCQYCVYFHTQVAKANGATDEEVKEAVAMASIVRHWSTVLNGMSIDGAAFRSEVDTVLRLAGEKAAAKK